MRVKFQVRVKLKGGLKLRGYGMSERDFFFFFCRKLFKNKKVLSYLQQVRFHQRLSFAY